MNRFSAFSQKELSFLRGLLYRAQYDMSCYEGPVEQVQILGFRDEIDGVYWKGPKRECIKQNIDNCRKQLAYWEGYLMEMKKK